MSWPDVTLAVAIIAGVVAVVVPLALPYVRAKSTAQAKVAALDEVNRRLAALEAVEMQRSQRFPPGMPRRAG